MSENQLLYETLPTATQKALRHFATLIYLHGPTTLKSAVKAWGVNRENEIQKPIFEVYGATYVNVTWANIRHHDVLVTLRRAVSPGDTRSVPVAEVAVPMEDYLENEVEDALQAEQ